MTSNNASISEKAVYVQITKHIIAQDKLYISLTQWFSAGACFPPSGHLAKSGDVSVVITWGRREEKGKIMLLVYGEQKGRVLLSIL